MAFVKAVKTKSKTRIAVTGPSGAGKTMTSLLLARELAAGGRIAAIDSEFGSMSKYADRFDFDVMDLAGDYHPSRYAAAIQEAEAAGFAVCVIDSLTHAWTGTKDVVDKRKLADRNGNGFTAWSEGTKLWDALQNTIMGSKMHVIVTMRSKTAYAQEKDEKGRTVIRKLGMEPETRDGSEFAYDLVLDMDTEHVGRVSKTRCAELDGYAILKPGADLGQIISAWVGGGADPKRQSAAPDRLAKIRQRYLANCAAAAQSMGRELPEHFEAGDDWDEDSFVRAAAHLREMVEAHNAEDGAAE